MCLTPVNYQKVTKIGNIPPMAAYLASGGLLVIDVNYTRTQLKAAVVEFLRLSPDAIL